MTKISLLLRLNNFIQPVGQLRGDGFNGAELMSLPASHTTSLLPSVKSAAVASFMDMDVLRFRSGRGQIMSVASSRSRPVHGHGLAVLVSMIADTAWPLRGHSAATSWTQNHSLTKE